MQTIHTDAAPQAVGPYAQAVVSGGFVYTAGQIGLDPATMTLVDGVEAQVDQVLANLDAVLRAAGSARTKVIKTTIFLADMNDYETVNRLYGNFFGDHKPARSTVQVARLPRDARVEIEWVAAV
jgi:2-iminobutanoate/2-iminopropanoate deaminase